MQFFGSSEISPSIPVPTASGNNGHMIYVFNRNGVCLLYREWNRPLRTLDSNQDHKLMFGLLFSLKSLTAKMDPSSAEKGNLGVPQLPGQGCSFHSFRTNTYKLSFMESPSGIKYLANATQIILVTHPKASDLRESLKYIYNLYVEYVVKNPLYTPGTPIKIEKTEGTVTSEDFPKCKSDDDRVCISSGVIF
ncbi:trafficking protein particle complex subunit 1 [Tanacetum coccineum]|uniref:Trafficking protein particle complex subunit n=1 Tax=Tanacetum coccineum TaxID=301880 RepID=A0ABQ5J1H5_9ASTR